MTQIPIKSTRRISLILRITKHVCSLRMSFVNRHRILPFCQKILLQTCNSYFRKFNWMSGQTKMGQLAPIFNVFISQSVLKVNLPRDLSYHACNHIPEEESCSVFRLTPVHLHITNPVTGKIYKKTAGSKQFLIYFKAYAFLSTHLICITQDIFGQWLSILTQGLCLYMSQSNTFCA